MSEPLVILVDENDREIGQMNKLESHQKGVLHRAISVLIFNTKGELLLQQRAMGKYHSPGLWTNTCCSHPIPGEKTLEAAERRLKEEMGMKTTLTFAFSFTYNTVFDNGLIENEFDHVYYGHSDELPIINPEEVMDYKYIDLDTLRKELKTTPDQFTSWFKIMFPKITCLG